MVGAQGFEPWTFCSQSRRATGLRYTPKCPKYTMKSFKNQDGFPYFLPGK